MGAERSSPDHFMSRGKAGCSSIHANDFSQDPARILSNTPRKAAGLCRIPMLWVLFLMATRQCQLVLFCSCRLPWHSGAGSRSGEERGNRGAPGILSWHRCSQRQPGSMRGHPESIILARQKLVLAARVWAAGDIWSTHPHVKPRTEWPRCFGVGRANTRLVPQQQEHSFLRGVCPPV